MHLRDKLIKLLAYLKTLDYYFVSVLLVAATLRFVDLGYSDYQGDENKAFYTPTLGQTFVEFVLDQKKGPVQFIVTFITKYLSTDYTNRFVSRLPFALAGFFAIFFFYKFVKLHFGKKAAFLSSFLLATNGFLIAFSRIVQYQSLVIFFMILALYLFSKAVRDDRYRFWGMFGALISWALSMLSHYDGIFIAPFMFYLLVQWFRKYFQIDKKKALIDFALCSILPVVLVLAFYVPFFLSLASSTLLYWQGRISGSVSGKISSSKYLFVVYHPIYIVHIYTLLAAFGALYIAYRTYLDKRLNPEYIYLLLWVAFGVVFMEKFVSVPGTHIYTYLVPATIILSLGVILIQKLVIKLFRERFGSVIFQTCVIYIFIFMFTQMYAVYVDNYREYPWEQEKFVFWSFYKPSGTYHLSLFGFPYNRNWDSIRKFVLSFPEVDAYSGNERTALSRYYIPLLKDVNKAGFFIYIRNPQTLTNEIKQEKLLYWIGKHEPLYVYSRNGEDLVSIYQMPPRTLPEIIQLEQTVAPK